MSNFVTLLIHHAVTHDWHSSDTEQNVTSFDQMGKTALHDAAIKGNAEMVAYMMEQVNPNVDARDVVGGFDVYYVLHYIMLGQTTFVPLREEN